jgi:NADH-quinone oxidoreductase subunit B
MALNPENKHLLNDPVLDDAVVLTKLEEAVNWGRESSLWPMVFGTACCAIEFMATAASKYDLARFGAEAIRFSPRQADLMIVAGTISNKQAPILKQIWDQMTEPKWCISMGACASSGGFYDNYTTVQGIDDIIPVDVYVAGCPPRPEAVLDAIMHIQQKVKCKPNRDGLKTTCKEGEICK